MNDEIQRSWNIPFGTVQTLTNINTNPRAEQHVVTRSTELAEFYKEFFDNREYVDPTPWWVPWRRQHE